MNAEQLLAEVEALGVRITLDREDLLLRPRSRLTPGLVQALRAHKAELWGLVESRIWPPESLEAERQFGHRHARLYPFLGRTVETPQGLGRLVQAFADRAAVVLDADRSHLTFFLPAEIRPPGAPAPRELGPAGPVH